MRLRDGLDARSLVLGEPDLDRSGIIAMRGWLWRKMRLVRAPVALLDGSWCNQARWEHPRGHCE